MKKVLCVVASLNAGGAETFLMKLLRCIDKSEYMMDFIVSAPGIYDEEVTSLGGKIYRVPLRTEHPIKTFNQIRTIVKKNKYNNFLKLCDTPIGVFDLLAAKMGGATHISVRSCNASSNTSKKKEMMYSILRPMFNALSDCKIAPSDLAAEYTFGEKCFRNGSVKKLNNGIDLSVYKFDEKARKAIRNEYEITEDTEVLGHIGRFNQQKNHIFLIDIFNNYHKMKPNSKLLLVGNGELIEKVHKYVKNLGLDEYVIFAGIKKNIPQILSAMDCFILPSFYEGMPNTVIEAQATGLPCVISDTITREANITGLVQYISLNESFEQWTKIINEQILKSRENVQDSIFRAGYDIQSVVREFEKNIFE
ncbi:glycosyltransferase family 1 protein [Dorea longicatena]|uniref:glycosyltransferase family 1 protein n=1 Tax=Dorea longicatena TaxID=88431 RepID=UPI0011061050|nr:glycosyltransferase family 1 protein [Dorea longicatena]